MAGGIADLNLRVGMNLQAFEAGLTKMQKELNKASQKMQSVGKTMTASITAPLAAIGGLSVKTFADFELGMAKVKAITGATGKEFAMLQKSAEDLGASTKFTATEVAGLQLELAKLGLNPAQITASTDSILALAQAFDQDLGESAAVAAKTMNAFGLEAKDMGHITDVMAKSFGSSALDMQAFGDAMQYAGAAGKASGASLEEVTAMIGTLADSGINASAAGTSLRKMFIVAAESGKDLNDMLKEINGSQNKLAAASAMFGKTAANQALILAENADKVRDLSTAFENADGTAKAMQKTMDNTLAGGMAKMKSALEAAAITIGKNLAPMVASLAGWIAELANKFKGLSPETQKFILIAAGIAAAIGPVLFVLGSLIKSLGTVGRAISKVGKLLMANPWAIALAGVIALVGMVSELNRTFDTTARTAEAYQSVQKRTNELAAEEYANVNQLTAALNNKTAGRKSQAAALEELKKKYPGYLQGMTLENSSLEQINAKLKDVTKSILKKAKIQALEEELVKVYKEQMDAQNELNAAMKQGTKVGTGFTGWVQKANNAMGNYDAINGMSQATSGLTFAQAQAAAKVANTDKALKALQGTLTEETGIKNQASAAAQLADSFGKADKNLKRFKKVLDVDDPNKPDGPKKPDGATEAEIAKAAREKAAKEAKELREKQAAEKKAAQLKLNRETASEELRHSKELYEIQKKRGLNDINNIVALQAQENALRLQHLENKKQLVIGDAAKTQELNNQIAVQKFENQKALDAAEIAQEEAKVAAKRQLTSDSLDLASTLISGLQAFGIKSKGLALAQIAIDTAKGVSGAIAAGAGQPFPLNLGAIASGVGAVLSGIASAKNTLSSAPAFAEGGMVTGPMMAMVGDNPSGKEAIIPFEKMGKFVNMVSGNGGGGGYPSHVTLTARGEDLVAVLNKANRSKSRAT